MSSARRSKAEGSSTTTGRRGHHNRPDQERPDNQRVLDPDSKIDRTPKPLRKEQPSRNKKRGHGPPNGESQETGQSSNSHSMHSHSEERSHSRLESTESGSTPTGSYSAMSSQDDGDTYGMGPSGVDASLDSSSLDSSRQASEQDSRMRPTGRDQPTRGRREDEDEEGEEEKEAPKKEWTVEQKLKFLHDPETVTLAETSTFILLDRPDEQIARDSEEAPDIIKRNEVYLEMCNGRESSKYLERGMQTFNNPCKNKDTQFTPNPPTRASVGVTRWDIEDTLRKMEEEENESEGEIAPAKEGDEEGGGEDEEGGLEEEEAGGGGDGDEKPNAPRSRSKGWMLSPQLPHVLMILERMVVQNIWQEEQLMYCNVDPHQYTEAEEPTPPVTSGNAMDDTPVEPSPMAAVTGGNEKMRILWRYHDPSKKKSVSCLAWNRKNADILAVGYGEHTQGGASGMLNSGQVCCWSLKNPTVPERTLRVETSGVSSVDWSHNHPSLLAVGNTDGTLALYDIRKQSSTPALRSTVQGGQHTGTVWEVKWEQKGKDRGETLYSVSSDGVVKDWSIKKGLECTNLLKLKRTPSKQQGVTEAKGDTLLSRQSGGMCIDFNPNQSERMIYMVGTEDGTVKKCSTSYNDQSLLTYDGHAGPVYRCRWSPFSAELSSGVFLTCSADWTTKLWDINRSDVMFTFQSASDAVHDLAWSPTASTVFTTVTSKGRVDMWDLQNALEPIVSMDLEGRALNCVAFAQQSSPVMVIGDDQGDVTVLKLSGSLEERRGADALQKCLSAAGGPVE